MGESVRESGPGDFERAGKWAPAGTSESSWEELLGSGLSIRGGVFPTGSCRPPNTVAKMARYPVQAHPMVTAAYRTSLLRRPELAMNIG